MFARLKKAEVKVRYVERARQAEHDAAIRAEQAAAESANREVISQGERNAPRDAAMPSQIAVETLTACGRPSE
jgi:hypothetical protein